MRIIPALAAAIVSLSACSQEQQNGAPLEVDWVIVAETIGSDQVMHVDRNSIRAAGDVRQYDVRMDYVNNPNGWKVAEGMWEDNCATGESRVLRTVVKFVDGRSFIDSNASDLKKVPPNSMTAKAHDFVCGR